jgi:hypothetical protein
MRAFDIPENIQLRDEFTQQLQQVVSFYQWACLGWLKDTRWNGNIARLIGTTGALRNIPSGQRVKLEDAEWEILVQCIKTPQGDTLNLNPLVAMQVTAFGKAVLEAAAE